MLPNSEVTRLLEIVTDVQFHEVGAVWEVTLPKDHRFEPSIFPNSVYFPIDTIPHVVRSVRNRYQLTIPVPLSAKSHSRVHVTVSPAYVDAFYLSSERCP